MSKPRFAIVGAAIALALAAIPIPSAHCPDWDVTVVDESGAPVPDVTVRLSYTNYSAEDAHHESERTTDKNGRTAFGRETLYASSLRRAYYALMSARAGVHASFGPYASITAFGRGLEGSDVDATSGTLKFWHGQGSRMESKIVVKRVRFP